MSVRGDVVVVVVAFVAAAACFGCSNPGPAALRGSPEAVVRAAAERTRQAGGTRVAVTVGADLAGTGQVDLATGKASFEFSRTGNGAHVGDHFQVVAEGPSEWVQAAGGLLGTTPDRPWLRGSPSGLVAALHARIAPLDTLLLRPGLGTDVAFLRGATKVKPYGGQEVSGVNTYRFSFAVDLQQAIANSPAVERPQLQAAADAIGPVRWPADVWLDAQGRVRRLLMAEDPFAHTTTTKANPLFTQDGNYVALTNIQFDAFGTAVAISAPPPDQAVAAPR